MEVGLVARARGGTEEKGYVKWPHAGCMVNATPSAAEVQVQLEAQLREADAPAPAVEEISLRLNVWGDFEARRSEAQGAPGAGVQPAVCRLVAWFVCVWLAENQKLPGFGLYIDVSFRTAQFPFALLMHQGRSWALSS